jgi:hypothetical protein
MSEPIENTEVVDDKTVVTTDVEVPEEAPVVKSVDFIAEPQHPRYKKRTYALSEVAIDVVDKLSLAFKVRESVIIEAALKNYLARFKKEGEEVTATVSESVTEPVDSSDGCTGE